MVEFTSPTTSTASGCSRANHGLEPPHNLRGLRGMAAGADLELDVRAWDLEIIKEDFESFAS